MKPVVIIGSGMAGYSFARELRKLNKSVPITIITADSGGYYSKPSLSNAFALKKLPAQLVTQSAAQMAEQLSASVLIDTRIERIDPAAHTIEAGGASIAYSTLVLAVGAQPIRLAIGGDAGSEVLSVNNIDDYVAFRIAIDQRAEAASARITILGAGLIGCEFADDLAGAGHAVTLVDPSQGPLAALTSPALSAGLHQALTQRGIALCLGTTAAAVDRKPGGSGLTVTLANGNTHGADLVLSAVGLRPDLRLAQSIGLNTGRGILVDAFGQSSHADIYALGDCAEYATPDGRSRVLPYVAPLLSAARAIARTLTGQPTEIDHKPMPVMVKTPSYPLALMPPSPHLAAGVWHTTSDDKRLISCCYDQQEVMTGFGVSHHDMATRTRLTSEIGQSRTLA